MEKANLTAELIKNYTPIEEAKSDIMAVGFTLISATYGSGGTRVDVLKQVNKNIKDSRLNMTVNKDTLGDPIPYYQKYLSIEYRYQGKRFKKDFHEGANVTLPP